MKLLLDIYTWLQKNARPPSAFSWQTLIVLSLFSYYMALMADGWLENLLTNFGWIFLILGVFWGTTSANQLRIGYKENIKDGFPLSPWITGALVSMYIFGGNRGDISQNALVYWPIISALIATIPDFLGEKAGGGVKIKRAPLDKRQNLVILFASQFLLSCWFQFYFVIQDWLVQYPSLMADDFRKSAFVVKWESELPGNLPRGATILDAMEPKLRDQLNAKRWPEVERRLLPQERTKLIDRIAKQIKQQIPPLEEDGLWQVKSSVSSKASGYNMDLRADWQGPRSKSQRTIVKSCQITQAYQRSTPATKPLNAKQTSPAAVPVSRFACQSNKGWGIDEPMIANDSFTQ